jgi:hypothetical protein
MPFLFSTALAEDSRTRAEIEQDFA